MLRRQISLVLILASLIAILEGIGQAQAQSAQDRVVINQISIPDQSEVVEAYVSVIAGEGRAVSGLSADAFSVLEDGAQVGAQIDEEQVGLAVMILVDLSGSMVEPGAVQGQDRLESAKEIIQPFILNTLQPDDWVGVVGFHVKTPFSQELTQDHGAASNTVTEMAYDPRANTALLNTSSSALDQLHAHPDTGIRKLLLIVSDGKDYLEAQDQVAYEESREALARKAQDYGIPIYSVGIDSYCSKKGQRPGCVRNWPENAYESQDIAWLADQTYGGYVHYGGQDPDSQDKAAVQAFLAGLVSQGRQYHVRYPAHAAKGQHEIEVQVATGGATSSAKATFYSPFELPAIRIATPADGFSLDLQTGSTISVEVEVSFPDSRPRDLEKVILYDGGEAIATLTAAPYVWDWDVSTRSGTRTLRVEGIDTVIRDRLAASAPVAVQIIPLPPTPEPLIPPPPVEGSKTTWFVKLLLDWLPLILVAAVAVVFVIVLGLRRQIAKGIKKTTTWVKRQTAVLTPGPRGAVLAKLIGTGGVQYIISGRHLSFGSEPQLCDEVLPNDRYISGKHFTVVKETDAFYVVDENSKNGTRVNGQVIPPGQRVPLADGVLITVGQTNLQFRIGNVTVTLP
jgi:Mg-chelatase subunit ChlD